MATSRGSRLLDGKYRAILDYPKVLGLTPGLFLSSNFRPMGLPIFLLPLSESGAPRCSHHISGFPAFGELIELQAMLLGSVHIVVWARNCGRGVFAALGKGSSLRERGRDGGGQQASNNKSLKTRHSYLLFLWVASVTTRCIRDNEAEEIRV